MMATVMSGKTLDRLAFAMGAGKPILAAINAEALARSHAEERRDAEREAMRKHFVELVRIRASKPQR